MKAVAWTPEALAHLSAGSSAFGPLASIEEMMHGADLWEYRQGLQKALVAVRPVRFAAGERLDVVGLRSLGDRLAGRRFHAALDALAADYGAGLVALCTNVPHVAKSCLKNGYQITGAVLTKKTGFQNGQ